MRSTFIPIKIEQYYRAAASAVASGPAGHTALSPWDFSLLLHIPVDWYFLDTLVTPYPKNTDRYSYKMLLKYLVRSSSLQAVASGAFQTTQAETSLGKVLAVLSQR